MKSNRLLHVSHLILHTISARRRYTGFIGLFKQRTHKSLLDHLIDCLSYVMMHKDGLLQQGSRLL